MEIFTIGVTVIAWYYAITRLAVLLSGYQEVKITRGVYILDTAAFIVWALFGTFILGSSVANPGSPF